MAMTMTAVRQPFGEITGDRLRNLSSVKNVQNTVTQQLTDLKHLGNIKNTKGFLKPSNTFLKPANVIYKPNFNINTITTKRARDEVPIYNNDSDGDDENIDPAELYTKRARTNNGSYTNSMLTFNAMSAVLSMPAPDKKLTTNPYQFPGGRSSTPAGRSPQRSSRVRYTAVYPPTTNTTMPSMDEVVAATKAINAIPTARKIAKPTPPSKFYPKAKGLDFQIFIDTDENMEKELFAGAVNSMDLSSDDEKAARFMEDGGNKENVAPAGHVSPNTGKNTKVKRRRARKAANEMVVDDEPRVPLAELLVEDFIGEGVDPSSFFVIPEDEPLPPVDDGSAVAATQPAEIVFAEDA